MDNVKPISGDNPGPRGHEKMVPVMVNETYDAQIIDGKPERFDGIEVQGVRTEDGVNFEPNNHAPTSFSTYLHLVEGGVECVGDFSTREAAQKHAAALAEAYNWPISDMTMDPVAASAATPEIPAITDLNSFANVIVHWHHNVQSQLSHMVQIPAGAAIEYEAEDKPGVTETIVLEGDTLKAYRIGVLTAMNAIEVLPFKAIVEDEPAAAANAPDGS